MDETFQPEAGLGLEVEIQQENGRWAVYLITTFWAPARDLPIERVSRRIQDFPSRRQAEVAAAWYLRGAQRTHLPFSEI